VLQTIKRMVGAERNDNTSTSTAKPPAVDRNALEAPVTAAREKLRLAAEAHQQSRTRTEELARAHDAAEAAFDVDASDANADRVTATKQALERHELFATRTQRVVVTAEGEVTQATAGRDAIIRANLEDRYNGAGVRIAALWTAKGQAALQALAAITVEIDEIIADAQAANAELSRMLEKPAFPGAAGLNALRGTVLAKVEGNIGAPRLLAIVRLLGG